VATLLWRRCWAIHLAPTQLRLLLVPEATGLFWHVNLHSAPLGVTRRRQVITGAMNKAAGTFQPTASVSEVLAQTRAVTKAARWFGLKSGMPLMRALVRYGPK